MCGTEAQFVARISVAFSRQAHECFDAILHIVCPTPNSSHRIISYFPYITLSMQYCIPLHISLIASHFLLHW